MGDKKEESKDWNSQGFSLPLSTNKVHTWRRRQVKEEECVCVRMREKQMEHRFQWMKSDGVSIESDWVPYVPSSAIPDGFRWKKITRRHRHTHKHSLIISIFVTSTPHTHICWWPILLWLEGHGLHGLHVCALPILASSPCSSHFPYCYCSCCCHARSFHICYLWKFPSSHQIFLEMNKVKRLSRSLWLIFPTRGHILTHKEARLPSRVITCLSIWSIASVELPAPPPRLPGNFTPRENQIRINKWN